MEKLRDLASAAEASHVSDGISDSMELAEACTPEVIIQIAVALACYEPLKDGEWWKEKM